MKLVIRKKTLLYLLLIFPILKINYFSHFPIVNAMYQFTLLFSLGYCIILYLNRRTIPSSFVLLFLLLEGWIYVQTYLNHGNISEVMRVARGVLCMAFIIDLFSDDMQYLLKILYQYFMFFSIINLILMIIFPNGIYAVYSSAYGTSTVEWLFGVGNVSISWHYPAVVVAWFYSTIMRNNKYGWYMSMIALVSHIIDGSATTIVGILVILLFQNISLIKKIITPKLGCILVAISFVLVVIQQQFDFLEPFIVGFLGKDMTFTGRLLIWSNAFNAFLRNPIFGYGIMYSKDTVNILGIIPNVEYLWEGATHCHDNYLQILFTGGIVAGAIYFLLYRTAIKKLSYYWKHPMAKIISGCLLSFLVIQISEAFDNIITMYLVLILAVNADKLIVSYEKQKLEEG